MDLLPCLSSYLSFFFSLFIVLFSAISLLISLVFSVFILSNLLLSCKFLFLSYFTSTYAYFPNGHRECVLLIQSRICSSLSITFVFPFCPPVPSSSSDIFLICFLLLSFSDQSLPSRNWQTFKPLMSDGHIVEVCIESLQTQDEQAWWRCTGSGKVMRCRKAKKNRIVCIIRTTKYCAQTPTHTDSLSFPRSLFLFLLLCKSQHTMAGKAKQKRAPQVSSEQTDENRTGETVTGSFVSSRGFVSYVRLLDRKLELFIATVQYGITDPRDGRLYGRTS